MTYSVVARDEGTGEIGIACQSHYFAVAAAVTWAAPGVGVVATQASVQPSYGWQGLAAMRGGTPVHLILDSLLAHDALSARRQVAVMNAQGELAVHTGEGCLGYSGSIVGTSYSVQGNMLSEARVLDRMAEAMEADRPLADRMLGALVAAEEAGGDVRGAQSATITVVSGSVPASPWAGRLIELRVEDHPAPVDELRRLLVQHRLAQRLRAVQAIEGLVTPVSGGPLGALRAGLAELDELAGQQGEVAWDARMWRVVLLCRLGRLEPARVACRDLLAARPRLSRLLTGLVPELFAASVGVA